MYRKISGKSWSHRGIPINAAVVVDLTWLRDIISSAIGIRFTDVGMWADHDADMVIWTDASLHNALAFIYSNKGWVYPIRPPPEGVKVDIFFLELLAITLAVHHTGSLPCPPHRLLVWTDSLDSVAVLNSMLPSHYTMRLCWLLPMSSSELGWICVFGLSRAKRMCTLTCYLVS